MPGGEKSSPLTLPCDPRSLKEYVQELSRSMDRKGRMPTTLPGLPSASQLFQRLVVDSECDGGAAENIQRHQTLPLPPGTFQSHKKKDQVGT